MTCVDVDRRAFLRVAAAAPCAALVSPFDAFAARKPVPLGLEMFTLRAEEATDRMATLQAPPAKTDCSAPEHRQFDFWLGSWDMTTQGKPAGTNRIESAMGGCALLPSTSTTAPPRRGRKRGSIRVATRCT